MLDFFLPADDRTVAIQLGAVLAIGIIGLAATRRRPELRLLVAGFVLVALGGIGLRALH
jgi:hypothetical protein